MKANLFTSIKSKTFETREYDTLEALANDLFTQHAEIAVKQDAPCINFANYSGTTRKKTEIIDLFAVALDVDDMDDTKVENFIANDIPYASILHSSFSHSSEPGCAKFRVFVFLKKPVSMQDYPMLAQILANLLGLDVDRVSFEPNQLYFLPTCPIGKAEDHFIFCDLDKPQLDPDSLLKLATNPIAAKKTKSSSNSDDMTPAGIAAELFKDVFKAQVITVDGRCNIFRDSHWVHVTDDELTHLLITSDYAKWLDTTHRINEVIKQFKARSFRKEFPAAKADTINMANGVLDVVTGNLLPHDPTFFHRNILDFDYNASGTTTRWMQCLQELFAPDADIAEKMANLQEWMGLLLVPDTRYQKLLLLVGNGSNGKSIVLQVMQYLLGETNYTSVPLTKLGQPFQNAMLHGKLAQIVPEVPTGQKIDEATLKAVVAGDSIYAELKGENGFNFKPYSRIIAAMNELPKFNDKTNGLYRRLHILQFNREFKKHEIDRDLMDKLLPELPGIMAWAVKGLQRLRKQSGFTHVPSADQALSDLREDTDPIVRFLSEKTVPEGRMLKGAAYAAYVEFCAANGYECERNSEFGKGLVRNGVKLQDSGGDGYYGFSLKSKAPPKRIVTDLSSEFA